MPPRSFCKQTSKPVIDRYKDQKSLHLLLRQVQLPKSIIFAKLPNLILFCFSADLGTRCTSAYLYLCWHRISGGVHQYDEYRLNSGSPQLNLTQKCLSRTYWFGWELLEGMDFWRSDLTHGSHWLKIFIANLEPMQVDVICCQRVTLNQAQVTFGTNRATRPLISTLILLGRWLLKLQ